MNNVLRAETRPTPRPAKNRPAMNKGCRVAAVCRITPRLKTRPAETINPSLRPRRSPNGAAKSAPKNVPADRMETMSESSDAEMVPSELVENERSQNGMARMPEIVPRDNPSAGVNSEHDGCSYRYHI